MNLLDIKAKILHDVTRSPTVHNVQPFRLRFHENELFIIDDTERMLTVGDPEENDHELSLGAFVESLSIALSAQGLKFKRITFHKESLVAMRIRAKVLVEPCDVIDPLYAYVHERRCYRGKFPELETTEERKLITELKKVPGVHILAQGQLKKNWATLYDKASYSFLSKNAYMEELYRWMRLTKDHPFYDADGLNAKALSLNWIEAFFGDFLLQPHMYEKMKKLGLGPALISEAPQIQSSLAVVAIFADKNLSLIDQGRAFLRTWLEITKLGLNVTPMSALSDAPATRKKIEDHLSNEQHLLTVFRVGKVPQSKVYTSPRLKSIEA